jgi:hypothetical protein
MHTTRPEQPLAVQKPNGRLVVANSHYRLLIPRIRCWYTFMLMSPFSHSRLTKAVTELLHGILTDLDFALAGSHAHRNETNL